MADEIEVVQAVQPESSEAEAANRTVDAREEGFQEAQVKQDKLNITKQPPQETSWERDQKVMHDAVAPNEVFYMDRMSQDRRVQKPGSIIDPKNPDKKQIDTIVASLPEDKNNPPHGKKEEKKQEQQAPKNPFPHADPVFAYYGNDKKSLLHFVLRHEDGPSGQPGGFEPHQIYDTPEHRAAWYWVHKLVGQETINKNTSKEIDRLTSIRKKQEVAEKDHKHKANQEELFQAKISAFEMDVVRTTSQRELKSKIRRSKSIMELTAYVGAIIAMETLNGTKATD
tara:strand:+ start:408 stop:1256 length:849 start_codon:yes stop_codon:yes gene_type:complete